MKNVLISVLLLLATSCFAQNYWTHERIASTAGVTALHLADAAQTCYHLHEGYEEIGFGTPRNCPGAALYLVGVGPVLQYASYRMARRFGWWKWPDRVLPYVEMSVSISAIRCSYSKAGCNQWGY